MPDGSRICCRQLTFGLAVAALTLASGTALQAQTRGGTLTVGLPYDIDTLNVYSTGFLGDVQAATVEGLVAPNAQAKYVPVLATEVPTVANGGIEMLDGGKRMRVTYHLRPGAKWHDGRPVTSADVLFTWQAVKDPKFIAESKQGTEDIESITTPDPQTAVVTYKTVSPNFASTLFTFGLLPKHTLEGKDLNTDAYNQTPLGTGPFVVKEFKRGQYVTIDRNPDYWRRDDKGQPLPYLDRIVFKILPDSNTLVTQIRSGEVQFAYAVPYSQAKQLEGAKGIEIIKAPLLSWQHLDFNFRGPKAFQDIRVRRAIAKAISRDVLIKAAGGYPIPLRSVVVPVLADLYDPAVPVDGFDPAEANRLLDEAGYAKGSDGIRAKGAERMSYKILAQAGRTDDEVAQQVIIAELKAVGIEAAADNKTGVAFRDARYKGGYDLFYSRWITAADPIYSNFFGTKGPNNGQGYSNPQLDAVLDKMENTLDVAERKQYAKEMQKILYDDLPTIPLVTNVSIIAKSTALKNVEPNPTNMTNFVDTSRWYLER